MHSFEYTGCQYMPMINTSVAPYNYLYICLFKFILLNLNSGRQIVPQRLFIDLFFIHAESLSADHLQTCFSCTLTIDITHNQSRQKFTLYYAPFTI